MSNAVLVGLDRGIIRLQAGRGVEGAASVLQGPYVTSLISTAPRGAVVLAGTLREGVLRSEDGGGTWRPASSGLTAPDVTALASSPWFGSTWSSLVWAGTEPSMVHQSDDLGRTWQPAPSLADVPSRPTWRFPPRPYTHHVRWLLPDAAKPGLLYASIEAGAILRSWDGGRAWHDRVPGAPRDAHGLASHPHAPGRVYAAAGEGYFESTNFGDTWRSLEEGLAHHYLWSVAVDPGEPGTVLVSAARGPGAAHSAEMAESTVYSRRAAGQWQEARDGLPPAKGTMTAVLATDDATPGLVYHASNRGLYRSSDGGATWHALLEEWPAPFAGQRANALLVL